MDAQQIFDAAVGHLLRQNEKAQIVGHWAKYCGYRGQNGTKCAVGALIPDELYDARFEEQGICDVIWGHSDYEAYPIYGETPAYNKHAHLGHVLGQVGIGVEDQQLLSDLQEVHDELEVDEWPKGLRDVAEAYGLKWTFSA